MAIAGRGYPNRPVIARNATAPVSDSTFSGSIINAGSLSLRGGVLAAPVTISGIKSTLGSLSARSGVFTTSSTPPFVTSISADGRYFLDQYGQPLLIHGDSPWSMLLDLSSSQVDTYLANRAALGTNVLLCSLIGSVENGASNNNGQTYDGILPFISGDITNPNSTYWSRMDSYLSKAEALGITLMIYPMDAWVTESGTVFSGKSTTDCQTYGNWLATRWLSRPNIIWGFGGDYRDNAVGTDSDSQFNACLTGIRAAGDTRPATIQLNYYRSLSFDSSYWEQRVDFCFVYTYFPTYEAVAAARSRSWNTALGKPATRPALFCEGAYDNSHIDGGSALAIRRQAGWALTSGSPGCFTGQEGVWQFNSGWESLLSSAQSEHFAEIVGTIKALAKWHLLDPTQASSLVTAGRGTAYTFSSQSDTTYNADSDYVTAAVTPDKSLAVIYNPDTSTRNITISASAVGTNPALRRVDPSTGTSTGMTWTTTPTASTNSAGANDWLFIIEADPLPIIGSRANGGSLGARSGNFVADTVFSGSRINGGSLSSRTGNLASDIILSGTSASLSLTARGGNLASDINLLGSSTSSSLAVRSGNLVAEITIAGSNTSVGSVGVRSGNLASDILLVGTASSSGLSARAGLLAADVTQIGSSTNASSLAVRSGDLVVGVISISGVSFGLGSLSARPGQLLSDIGFSGSLGSAGALSSRSGNIAADSIMIGSQACLSLSGRPGEFTIGDALALGVGITLGGFSVRSGNLAADVTILGSYISTVLATRPGNLLAAVNVDIQGSRASLSISANSGNLIESASFTWYLWENGIEVPLQLEGVWDGNSILPITEIYIVE